MKKIAIIGASYLQEPLIQAAKKRGLETHVFAWKCGDIGERTADHFYPISITEKERILNECIRIGIDGICSISSDLASITVNYVAYKMGLIGNSPECVEATTNKHVMRKRFEENGDPSPRSVMTGSATEAERIDIAFPVIVKPLDRSGSRGITKVCEKKELAKAVEKALSVGFIRNVLVEEFVEGKEYSVEYISWEGEHTFLALTEKFTTGAPTFIETGHLEPADVDDDTLFRIQQVVSHALDSLDVKYGASHSEVKVSGSGEIKLIEIGARMGGDNIGSSLVKLSTGYDFVDAVIDVCLGIKPRYEKTKGLCAGIRFVMGKEDLMVLDTIKKECPHILADYDVRPIDGIVTDSSTRFGYFTMASENAGDVLRYMPDVL